MDDYKDLNELITVAKQINEGKYNLIDINLSPSSQLFSIAQFFNESIKKLKTASDYVGKSYEELPVFESVLNKVIGNSRNASEDVLSNVDKINLNIDEIKVTLSDIDSAFNAGEYAKAKGLCSRLRDSCATGSEVCYDIIASLEFKEIARDNIDKVLNAVIKLEDQLAELVISLGLKQQIITPEAVDKLKDPKDILKDQSLVDRLLKEFGI